ncbi:Meiosis regulator and mRNA stability factor 1 [Araneus ventricosus]|uniref:Meiosis regulator and mRNA stability factor 1 n=1 Tax=Araneus ventricosus TaxID=182803 RepID=A0A4Y2CAU7_ARAVE|nr:Meiosis regulator and mRNA stability factor 1 [Araneus ventricosus]
MEVQFKLELKDGNQDGSERQLPGRLRNILSTMVTPYIGVFWDYENCRVPKDKSPFHMVETIRERFCKDHLEAAFTVVLDATKEKEYVTNSLNEAQIDVVHVRATAKNAVDSKVKQSMGRFVRLHGAPTTLVLLGGDIDYAPDLSDYRHQRDVYIILIYNQNAHSSLLNCAHEHYPLSSLTENLPLRRGVVIQKPVELVISSLPVDTKKNLKRELLHLSGNTGGRIQEISGSEAILKFANANWAEKALYRMNNEKIGPNTISARIRTESETGGNLPRPSTSSHVHDVYNNSSDESVGAIESDSQETEEYSDFELGNITQMPPSGEGSRLRSTPSGLDVNPEEESSTASVPVVSPAQRRSFSDSVTDEEPQKKKKPKLCKKHWRKHQRRH